MQLTVIATGSSANCYVLKGTRHSLLLDAGVPMPRMIQLVKNDFQSIQGCLITHQHQDHSKGVVEVSKRGIPVYCSNGCKNAIVQSLSVPDYMLGIRTMQEKQTYDIGDFTVMPFRTEHDAQEPFGFLIRHNPTNENVVYATDTYYLRYRFPNIHYWIVECNYVDETLHQQLEDGVIPKGLKDRLLRSHMSLNRLKEALASNNLKETRKIVLVHMSDSRANEQRMVDEIHELTDVDTVAADAGMIIGLNLIPF